MLASGPSPHAPWAGGTNRGLAVFSPGPWLLEHRLSQPRASDSCFLQFLELVAVLMALATL